MFFAIFFRQELFSIISDVNSLSYFFVSIFFILRLFVDAAGIEPAQPSWFYLPHILANSMKQVHGDIAQLLHSKARPVLAPVCPSFRAVNYTSMITMSGATPLIASICSSITLFLYSSIVSFAPAETKDRETSRPSTSA